MARRWFLTISTIWLMAAISLPAQTKTASRVALVIGNAKYEAAVGPLRNAVNDAKSVSKTLRGLGFTVIEEHNVSRDELLEAVLGFRKRLSGANVALFYYAGHGISVGGANYLIPIKSDYLPTGGDAIARRMLAETKLFNVEQIVAEMSAAGGHCNLIVLDACRNTPVALDPNSRATNGGGLAEMKPPAGSLIAFATDAGHVAQDGQGTNGLYTGELIKHLQTPGLTIEQVFKRTRAGVMEQSDGKQVPAEYSRLIGDDIYLAGAAETPPATSPIPKARQVELPSPSAINKLAAEGKIAECVEAMRLVTAANGPGNFATTPIDALLEIVKEDLKELTEASPRLETTMETCNTALDAIRDCLPQDHARRDELTAKARNRLGDCLMLLGRSAEALEAYSVAVELAPTDAYPVYNRGRAYLSLGRMDEAKADFTTAASPKYKQPKARKLAQEALSDLR